MDVLENKQYKQYNSISRYSIFPFYYNKEDDKYVYGITSWMLENNQYTLHKIQQRDTLDSLALTYYGRPDYYWVIADFNRIQDPYIKLWKNYDYIKIPNLSSLNYER